jgi:ATP-dependent RNA helicase DeaD
MVCIKQKTKVTKKLTNFENMPISPELKKAVHSMGYKEATEVQEKVIPLIMKGNNVVSRSFTGSGKTAAFGIALSDRMMQGRTHAVLIICPTRELAVQVSEEVQKINRFTGFKVAAVYGGHKMSGELRELEKGVDILCATPGRLMDHIQHRAIDPSIFDTVVLDEADRMLDMGFIKEIKEILSFVNPEHTHLFSATLDGNVAHLIEKYIPDFKEVLIEDETIGKNILEKRLEHSGQNKVNKLIEIIESAGDNRVLVFVSTKRYADKLNHQLKDLGFRATSIHGDKTQKGREISLKNFKEGRKNVLIATDVAARGLQIDNVEFVVNFDRPNDADTYKHRVGRTGRMGAVGHAITFIPENAESRELWFDPMKGKPMNRGFGGRGPRGNSSRFGGGGRSFGGGSGRSPPGSRGGFRGATPQGSRGHFGGRGQPRAHGFEGQSQGHGGGRFSGRGHRPSDSRGFHGSSQSRRNKPRKSSDVNEYVYRS